MSIEDGINNTKTLNEVIATIAQTMDTMDEYAGHEILLSSELTQLLGPDNQQKKELLAQELQKSKLNWNAFINLPEKQIRAINTLLKRLLETKDSKEIGNLATELVAELNS